MPLAGDLGVHPHALHRGVPSEEVVDGVGDGEGGEAEDHEEEGDGVDDEGPGVACDHVVEVGVDGEDGGEDDYAEAFLEEKVVEEPVPAVGDLPGDVGLGLADPEEEGHEHPEDEGDRPEAREDVGGGGEVEEKADVGLAVPPIQEGRLILGVQDVGRKPRHQEPQDNNKQEGEIHRNAYLI
eukprot:TRINITY_DN1013_c0_g1_i1.p2 TRINITY_DN1013_c0_g1~~TRINITY_DN1013_c0_g1_i1.p2  ORF type:complete len:182 (-),score=14.22 TRINITY_DN1013_c0_g1_i1:107-652(-)